MFSSTTTNQLNRIAPTVIAVFASCITFGCSQNPYLASSGTNVAWQAQAPGGFQPGTAPPGVNPAINPNIAPVNARLAELSRRVQLLDDNNRQLHTQLAQSEQQSTVYRDELELVRKQLSDTTGRLESSSIAARDAQKRVQGLQASSQIRGNATIRANTNLRQQGSRLNLKGVPVRQDGDVIRIAVPSDQLFQPGTATMHDQAPLTLDPIVAQLRSVFPRQRIGIEGYTDNAPLYGGQVATSHQLASAQAASVLDLMTRRGGMPLNQLFTVAQGANNPRQSNATAAGRAANRRIEIVIYPETF